MCAQRLDDLKNGEYALGGGVVDPLPEDAPQDGCYYIMWGGFMKVPGVGGALNSVWVDASAEGTTASVAFQDINDLFYVKLAKWI